MTRSELAPFLREMYGVIRQGAITMGDKKGKKDKAKEQRQKSAKQEATKKHKGESQPTRPS